MHKKRWWKKRWGIRDWLNSIAIMTTDDKHSDDSSGTDENISGGREDTLSFYKLCFDFFIELLLL